MTIVIDASMALAWLLDDENSAAAEKVLRRVTGEGATVPTLWPLEVANALINAVRRGCCGDDHVDRSLQRLADLPISIDSGTTDHAWRATLSLAREEKLTVYDAAYLELAVRRRLSLANCDAKLLDAAERQRVRVHRA